jgi:ubiquitin-protein ligase
MSNGALCSRLFFLREGAKMVAWWGTQQEISPRLWLEVQAMRESFGKTFTLVVPRWGGQIHWEGTVEINLSILKSREHTLRIVYPDNFPSQPPITYIVRPRILSPIHQYEDGRLCLFNPRDGTHYGWNPARSTAVTVASWAIQWLYAYYIWRKTSNWPGMEESVTNPHYNDRNRRSG